MQTDLTSLTAYCLSKPAASAGYPFGEGALVFKVLHKMFALLSEEEQPLRLNLKCDPDDAVALRHQYPAIIPGYHMNKRHWNTLVLDGSLPGELVTELIDHSYTLVVQGLNRTDREKLTGC
ncbi:MAG: MmcQ/YjbR family DNA-binding protein [Anaerolineae bacterium]|nr:MmcQ/YjbR family DNA-binding protein [Anaerolineae bacterium]